MKYPTQLVALFAISALGLTACGDIADNNTGVAGTLSGIEEVAASVIGGVVRASETTLSTLPNACPTIQNGTCAIPLTEQVTYAQCSFGGTSQIWSGGATFKFAGGVGCPPILSSTTMVRTFSAGTTETTSAGVISTLDTINAATSGWDPSIATVANGETVLFDAAFPANGIRTILINGLHTSITAANSTQQGDFTISSEVFLANGIGTNLVLPAGPHVTVQSNLDRFTASIKITADLTYALDGTCCWPTAGTLTGTLSGSRVGTETLTFAAPCGSATFTNTANALQTITLTHCF